MRLLLLNQFYPPDVAPTGQFLHDLARLLASRGHEVHVVCSRRSYDGGERHPPRERLDGVHVHRVAALGFGRRRLLGRLADYGSYVGLASLESLLELPRPELVLALTTPPYLGLLGAALARLRRAAQAHWVMDVYPDVMAAHGLLRPDGRAFHLLKALARRQMRGARLVLALGPFMARALAAYAGPETRLEWVPLWGEEPALASPEGAQRARRERGWRPDDLVLLCSGNMGLGHRVAEFLEAAARLGPAGPLWAFAGGGVRRGEIESFARAHPGARIQLLPYVPRDRLPEALRAADVHLASLSSPWQGLVVSSKVQAAFSAGRPVIFVGPRENELAAWIAESGGGWIVGEDDVSGLLSGVEAARDPAERVRRGEAARVYARTHFDRARNGGRLVQLLEEAAGSD